MTQSVVPGKRKRFWKEAADDLDEYGPEADKRTFAKDNDRVLYSTAFRRLAGVTQVRNSKVAEMEIDGGDIVISGVKTVQVEVKE